MKKQILMASSIILLTSSLSALTIDEQVAANSIEIGLNSTSIHELSNNSVSQEERVRELEAMIVRLESYHGIRQFTVHGTSELDITEIDFRNSIASLNFQSGEFLYMKSISQRGTSEFCSSNPEMVLVINSYINDTAYQYSENNPENTWQKSYQNNPDWIPVYYHYFSSNFVNDSLYNYTFDTTRANYFTGVVYPDYYDDLEMYTGMEVKVNGQWDNIGNNSITYKVADTRYKACGF